MYTVLAGKSSAAHVGRAGPLNRPPDRGWKKKRDQRNSQHTYHIIRTKTQVLDSCKGCPYYGIVRTCSFCSPCFSVHPHGPRIAPASSDRCKLGTVGRPHLSRYFGGGRGDPPYLVPTPNLAKTLQPPIWSIDSIRSTIIFFSLPFSPFSSSSSCVGTNDPAGFRILREHFPASFALSFSFHSLSLAA